MRFAVLADIHANWPALEAALEDLDQQGEIHALYCLGDMVGYYPYPRECLDALLARGAECILGNHERYLLELVPTDKLRPMVKRPLELARSALSTAQLDYLRSLKDKRKIRDLFLLVHGSPRDADEYLERPLWNANLDVMHSQYADYPLCLFGHTHKAVLVSRDRSLRIQRSRRIRMGAGEVCLLNPGSVGQPRDRVPLASYLIYDSETRIAHFRRVEYPFEETQEAVRRLDWPEKLGWRLAHGR